jgi:hypothetical protein
MAFKITPEMINRRLAASENKPRQFDAYGQQVGAVDRELDDIVDDEDDSDRMSGLFMAGMAVTFLLIAGLTYYVMENGISVKMWKFGGNRSAFSSIADAKCKPMWESPGWNADALACYMAEYPDRFCDANERSHLVNLITRYRRDAENLRGKVIGDFMKNQKNIMADINKSIKDMEERETEGQHSLDKVAKPFKPKLNKYIRNVTFEQGLQMFQAKVFNPDSLYQQLEVSQLLRNILNKGYFETWEFGMQREKIVEDALIVPLPKVVSPCKV